MSTVIYEYLNERKAEWLKKKLSGDVDEFKKAELIQEAEAKYTLRPWVTDAAKRACQLSMATHLSKFTHPSAKTSTIIASCQKECDGYLRTGNVEYEIDVFGNAAAMDVYKFLSLRLEDDKTILAHLEINSAEIQQIFDVLSSEYESVRSGLLAIKQDDDFQITDGLVKQVYFPVGESYHLLSILTPSGMLKKIKNQLDNMHFNEETKMAKECRKNKKDHPNGYDEIYNLTVTAYGGTKPQNISVLNSQNGGKSYLFQSVPPKLHAREIRLPTKNFFSSLLRMMIFRDIRDSFQSLHALMKQDYNNKKIRNAINNVLIFIINQVLEKVFQVRGHSQGWSNTEHYKSLPIEQRIWLDDLYINERMTDDAWVKPISVSLMRWIITSYEKILKDDRIMLGTVEMIHVKEFIEEAIRKDERYFS